MATAEKVHTMFRFYITDMVSCSVKGTDNELLAEELSESEDYFVVDTDTGEWLNANNGRVQIEEWK